VLDAAKQACAGPGASQFCRIKGARPAGWSDSGGRWPTLAEFDSATGNTACVLMSFDHHQALANSAAMGAAGLTPGQKIGTHGEVLVDSEGKATGLLNEQAANAAWDAAPQPGPDALQAMLMAACEHLHLLGYVEVHDLLSPAWLGPALGELDQEGRLAVRVKLYAPAAEIAAQAAAAAEWQTEAVTLAGAKVFADGTLNARTALMIHRYDLPVLGHPRGQAMVSPMAIDEILRQLDGMWNEATELPLGLAVHAIGDGAVKMVLDCVERVRPTKSRVRIEHCEVIDKVDVPRFAAMGVDCSVQPCHLLYDIEALQKYIPHRLDRVLPIRELLESGLLPGQLGLRAGDAAGLVFGSDVPIVPADPRDSIQAAVHRRRVGMDAGAAIAPTQAISESQAWACMAAPRGRA